MWLIQSRQRDGAYHCPTLSQYEQVRVNSELSVGKFSLILRSYGSCPGNWIVTIAPCVVTAWVTGSHYNCPAQNPSGNQTSVSWQIIWNPLSSGHSIIHILMMTLNRSMNRIIKCCVRLLIVTVDSCLRIARGPRVTPWPPVSPAHHVSSSCQQLDQDNKLNQIGSQSSLLRYFFAFFALQCTEGERI